MVNKNPTRPFRPTINRVADLMAHSDQFAFKGAARLARAAGVSTSTVTRLVRGEINPSFALVARITEALEEEFKCWIDPRNIVAESARFLTRYVCDVIGCKGCLPDQYRDDSALVRPEWREVHAGKWVSSSYPYGFDQQGGR